MDTHQLRGLSDEDSYNELIDGQLVRKASPSWDHGRAQSSVATLLKGPFDRKAGRGGPGGWWLATEVDVQLAADQIFRPDVAGWRRDRVPTPPTEFPVLARPDWVCDVLSPSDPT